MNKLKKTLIVALIIGLLLPYACIVVTGNGSIINESTVDFSYATKLSTEQYKSYMQRHMRPMKFTENIYASAITAVAVWHIYLAWSFIIAAVVFVLNLFIFQKK